MRFGFALTLTLSIAFPMASAAQQIDLHQYDAMKWRCIGPHRGGRTVGAAGVPGEPNHFYIGVNNGGVWKTTDAGRTWVPVFDDQPTGSIGTLAVAPSEPNTIYVGSGEGLQRPDLSTGDGMYKSQDGGKTWSHLGLRDGQQITSIIVDPKNANRLFVGVLGHPYGPNPERGVFRSIDGGKTFQRVLFIDQDTGAAALAFDPQDARTIYASLWAARQGPWENGTWQGNTSGLFKSVDGGNSWKRLSQGLPTAAQGLGRVGISTSPAQPATLFAVVNASGSAGGVYRSDDRGEHWRQLTSQRRLWGRGDDFAEIRVDPKNPNTVYIANVCTYKSVDGGKTWVAWKGAPGGDDYHTIWISPNDPRIILLASDQGATITVNGGDTWSSWYNQPTAQFYHVSTDNRNPYWVYGGQQESGSVGIQSRGRDGQITFREWHPVGVEEYGYVAADPLDPNLIYGGKLTRFDWQTGKVEHIMPPQARGTGVRFLRTAPVLFSPVDPHMLLFAGSVMFKTTDAAKTWQVISPDLTRESAPPPPGSVFQTPGRRGVIYTIGPSYIDANLIWAGTDDGLIHVTSDGGKTWTNVTPPEVTPWSKVSIIDAGHYAKDTAYAAVNRIRVDDQKPYIYRTHDGGKSWKLIVNGLPRDPINCVREDPIRKGLLFCGSERAVYFSIDDGETWNPLRLNMPASSIRDLVIKDNDIVVGTHGRSFWILDDIAPLRQITGSRSSLLYKPSDATQFERNLNTDTPLPPEEPAGQNPPDGGLIYYYLPTSAKAVKLEILDDTGNIIRTITSADVAQPINEEQLQIPTYWIRPFQPLEVTAGSHRFVWDLRLAPPAGGRRYPISAIFRDTPGEPLGAWVEPGLYTIRLTVDGNVQEQKMRVHPDPDGK